MHRYLLVALAAAWMSSTGSAYAAEPAEPASAANVKALGRPFDYPDAAKRAHAKGRILLAFTVDAEGHAAHIEMKQQEGINLLADAARSNLAQVLFEKPADPNQTFMFSFVFEMQPCGKLSHFDVPKRAQISLCGSFKRVY